MPKRIRLYVLSVLTACVAGLEPAFGADAGPRESVEIDAGWRFQLDVHDRGEKERWFDPVHDRSNWRTVEVPRAWDTLDDSLRGFEGIGWYGVSLDGALARPEQIQRLTFGRVMYQTRAWLNGELLGEHVGGYLPFSFDVTGKLDRPVNQLVLRVDNRPRIDWLPAAAQIEWVQYGGILQPVRLESRGTIAISDLAVRAVPQGDGAAITCLIDVEAHEDGRDLRLRVAASGENQSVPLTIQSGKNVHQEIVLRPKRAARWSPASPTLHELTATLERSGQVIDEQAVKFGVRSIEARGRQLLLNGEPLQIRGVNRYDEYGRFGPNPPWTLVEDEVRLMRRAGVNLIRTHYPQSPEFLSLCDRLGILFMEELPINWWGLAFSGKEPEQNESILDQALPMLEAMIRRDRNHPCVIIWSMCNESKTDTAVGIKVMRRLIARTKELDPTRLVTFVTEPGSVRPHRAYEDADLVAFNMYPGSLIAPLADHIADLDERTRRPAEAYLRSQLAEFPTKPMLVTEFGAMGFHGLRGDTVSTEDFQAAYITSAWEAIRANPQISGGVLWSWADYHHRRHFQSLGAFGAFGVVTVDRQPKASLQALARAFGGRIDR
jgi:beta-glucuronidase